jgi:hypothetical protein
MQQFDNYYIPPEITLNVAPTTSLGTEHHFLSEMKANVADRRWESSVWLLMDAGRCESSSGC